MEREKVYKDRQRDRVFKDIYHDDIFYIKIDLIFN